jgi:hypothetical protein
MLGGLLSILTKSNAPAELIANVNEAIKQLSMVHGTLVTKAQVDSLLDQPKW